MRGLAPSIACLIGFMSTQAVAQNAGLVACYPAYDDGAPGAIVIGAPRAFAALEELAVTSPGAADWLSNYTVQAQFEFADVPLLLSSMNRILVLFDEDLQERDGRVMGLSALSYRLTAADTSGCEILADVPVCEMTRYPGFYEAC